MPFEVKKISSAETIDLRSRILRPSQAIELCHYPDDNLESSFHLGVIHKGMIVANGSFLHQEHPDFTRAKKSYRLRGMATDLPYQRQGLGSLILSEAMKELRSRECDFIWFNARTSAETFYVKLGFKSNELIFDIPLVGAHKIMYKWLGSE